MRETTNESVARRWPVSCDGSGCDNVTCERAPQLACPVVGRFIAPTDTGAHALGQLNMRSETGQRREVRSNVASTCWPSGASTEMVVRSESILSAEYSRSTRAPTGP